MTEQSSLDKHPALLPTLPFDSQRILELRATCQKPREKEEILAWFVLRRISIYVTLLFLRTRISPNTISWFSLLFFLLSGWWMIWMKPWAFVLATLCYNLGYLLDCVDGEVARLKQITSKKGVFIDTLIRASSIPIVISFMIALYTGLGETPVSLVEDSMLYFIAVMSTMALLIPISYNYIQAGVEERDPVGDMRATSRLNEWVAFLSGLPGFFALLPIVAGGEAWSGLPMMASFLGAFLVMFTMKTFIRCYITISALK